ncbi:DUF4013 domain-containing protein [Candidatus Woesearchaeota archaeon]|nr:DUF4013 domain-containing protein [Candidatus Woesearchaeota archaeon]
MVNYGAAFRLPFTNWGRFGTLFVLSLVISALSEATSIVSSLSKNTLVGFALKLFFVELALFAMMIFVYLIAAGYSLRIAGSATQGRNEFSSFENFFSLIVPGLKYFLAMLIYFIPFIIAMAIGFALAIGDVVGASSGLAVAGVVLLIPILLAWLVLAVYILPMLMAHFAHEGRFSAFFELRKVLKYAFTSAYFMPWLAVVGYSIALFIPYFIIALPISIISIAMPRAALLAAPVSALYSTILTPTVMNLYGQAYRDATAGGKAKTVAAATLVEKAKRKSKK